MKFTLKELILTAEFAAIISVLSQFTIPLGLIPLTGQTFAIGLAATFLGKKLGTTSVLLYLLLGLIGLPVFAGMSGGIGVLFGPTGGYLIGFPFQAWLTGWFLEKIGTSYSSALFANLLGAIATLIFGMFWLQFSSGLTLASAFSSGFLPFVLPGIIKAVGAAYMGVLLKRRLDKFLLAV